MRNFFIHPFASFADEGMGLIDGSGVFQANKNFFFGVYSSAKRCLDACSAGKGAGLGLGKPLAPAPCFATQAQPSPTLALAKSRLQK